MVSADFTQIDFNSQLIGIGNGLCNEQTQLYLASLKGNVRKAWLDTVHSHRLVKTTHLNMQMLFSNKILN